jgi:hypothetical protein
MKNQAVPAKDRRQVPRQRSCDFTILREDQHWACHEKTDTEFV